MSKIGALAKNTFILAFGKFSSQLVTFLMLPIYTAYLEPSEYGIVDLVVTYVALLAPTLTLQMQMAAFRFLIDARGDDEEKTRVFSNCLHICVLMMVPIIGAFILINVFWPIPYFWIIISIIFLSALSGLSLQTARGLGENLHFSIASIVMGVVTVCSNLILILVFEMGATGLLISLAVAHLATVLYLVFSLHLYRFISIRVGSRSFKRELLRYSTPLIPNGISWWVVNAADRTLISIFLGLAANGVFAIASKFPFIFTAIFSVFGLSWTESASLHINSTDRDQFFTKTFNNAFRIFGSLGIGIIAFLPFVFPIFVDSSFQEAYIYIPIMLLGALFNSVVGLYSAIYVAKKLTLQVASTSIIAAIISITINLIFIHFIGLFAAAAANAVAYLTLAIYRHFDAKKYVSINIEKRLILILTLSYALATFTYYLNTLYLNVFTAGAAIALAYILNRSLAQFVVSKVVQFLRMKLLKNK